jgi:RNA polymerase sigma factor (sigma-70 family)
MDDAETLAELVRHLQAGDSQAAEELFRRYAARLTRVAEQYLSSRVGRREDGSDVVQSVFRTFFRRNAAGQFHIDSSAQMWRLLVKITALKAQAKGRFHTAARRNVAAEVADEDQAWLVTAASGEPGPEEAATLADLVETLLSGLPPEYAQVLEMRLADQGVGEIAPQLGVSRQTVYRMLALLQDRLAGLDQDGQES